LQGLSLSPKPAKPTLLVLGSITAARKPPEKVEYPELHNLSVEDLHSSAAIIATLLLVKWMHSVEELPEGVCAAVQKSSATPEVRLL
jgi:hypothetical protein